MPKAISISCSTAKSCTAVGTSCACARAISDRHENWLLIKGKDEASRSGRSSDILEEEPLSAATGRSMDEIAEGKGKKRVWHSNRQSTATAGPASDPAGPQSQREFKTQLQALAASPRKKNSSSRTGKTAEEKRVPKRPPRRAAKPRSRAKAAVAAAASKRSGPPPRTRRSGRLPDFIPPILSRPVWPHCTTPRRAARIGCTRSNSTATASRRGSIVARSTADAQSSSIGRIASNGSRKPSRRCRPRRRSLTANWWSRTTKAFRVSRCCRPI